MKNDLGCSQTADLLKIIIEASNYRKMLNDLLIYWRGNIPNFSIQKFANEGGMKSKTVIMDLKSGRRKISLKTYPAVEKAFRIPEDLTYLFKLKFALECEELLPHYTVEEIDLLFQRNKNMFLERYLDQSKENIFGKTTWPIVFAALDNEKWQTFEDIAKKVSVSKLELRQILRELIHSKFIVEKAGDYKIEKKSLSKLKQAHNNGFKNFYINSLQRSLILAEHSFDDQNNIFAHANLCLKPKDIPYVRKRFNQLLSELINELDSPDGEHVSSICISMFHE